MSRCWTQLPDELVQKIASFLPCSLNICLVNKDFRRGKIVRTRTLADAEIPYLWDEALKAASLSKLRYSHPPVPQPMLMVIYGAAYRGDLAFLKQLESVSTGVGYHMALTAAYGGQLAVLQWVMEEHRLTFTSEGLPFNTHLMSPWQENPWKYAAFTWCGWVTFMAALGGHLELLQWAVDHGCPLERWPSLHPYGAPGIIKAAAARGREEVIRWALEHGVLPTGCSVQKVVADATEAVKHGLFTFNAGVSLTI